jgi:PadR family transcriptional regulator PadR
MGKREKELFQGTLDMLTLRALRGGPRHGYEIIRWIRQISGDELRIEEGALYPALHRIEGRDWVTAEWRPSETGRQAKFYSLTPAGRAALETETTTWQRYVAAVALVLEANG